MRDQVLHLARVLGRAVHVHAAVFLRDGVADLAFEVELLLAADVERALQAVRRRGDGARAPLAGFAVAAALRTRCIGGTTYCALRVRLAAA